MFFFLFVFFFLIFFIKACYGYSFELHRQVNAIQMGTHNICLYKEIDIKYTGCNLNTELLAFIGVYAVIRLNTVLCRCGGLPLKTTLSMRHTDSL